MSEKNSPWIRSLLAKHPPKPIGLRARKLSGVGAVEGRGFTNVDQVEADTPEIFLQNSCNWQKSFFLHWPAMYKNQCRTSTRVDVRHRSESRVHLVCVVAAHLYHPHSLVMPDLTYRTRTAISVCPRLSEYDFQLIISDIQALKSTFLGKQCLASGIFDDVHKVSLFI